MTRDEFRRIERISRRLRGKFYIHNGGAFAEGDLDFLLGLAERLARVEGISGDARTGGIKKEDP